MSARLGECYREFIGFSLRRRSSTTRNFRSLKYRRTPTHSALCCDSSRVADEGAGLIAGHEFSERLELHGETYDLQAANSIGTEPKQRSLTLDLGGRKTLDRAGHLRLLFLGGRAIQAVRRNNSEPSWIAYLGVQILFGPK